MFKVEIKTIGKTTYLVTRKNSSVTWKPIYRSK